MPPDLLSAMLAAIALPAVGLPALFIISLLSATLLPMGSEPAMFAVVKANPELMWPALAVATTGNTLGGAINYAMGYGARKALPQQRQSRWFAWLSRFGPKTLIFSWLPLVGDPLCVLAGWMELPLWRCVFWMALGKLLRYLFVTQILLEVPDSVWHQLLKLW
jgi:membrane protein YqaA with SNARE-associated domain